jgi:hypothetical protein
MAMSKEALAEFLRTVFGIISPLFNERLFEIAKTNEYK